MTFLSPTIFNELCAASQLSKFYDGMFLGADPTSWQVILLGSLLLVGVIVLVGWELFRKRREQLVKARAQWENFQSQARGMGLGEADVSLMRQMYQCLDALHAPDAMLRIPASYDRALDAWLASRSHKILPAEWEHLGNMRRRLGFKGLAAEMSLSHSRQISEMQEVRMASEDGHFACGGKVVTNQEDLLVVESPDPVTLPVGMRIRMAFSRQGDGEYKAIFQVIRIDRDLKQVYLEHTDQLTRQQLRMWVRVPVLIGGKMRRVIGPEGTPHPVQSFDVTLLDLSGGGAMVSSVEPVEVESRGLLDFQLNDARLEGVRFVMLRTGRNGRNGGHVCHLCFESIDVQTQERIMRYVFERQRTGRNVG
jgi:c-di-GMP-binding flagellar brake protein YcgR